MILCSVIFYGPIFRSFFFLLYLFVGNPYTLYHFSISYVRRLHSLPFLSLASSLFVSSIFFKSFDYFPKFGLSFSEFVRFILFTFFWCGFVSYLSDDFQFPFFSENFVGLVSFIHDGSFPRCPVTDWRFTFTIFVLLLPHRNFPTLFY